VGALPHARGERRLEHYEKVADAPQTLAHWEPYTAPDGRRYLTLYGRPEAVALVRREFETNVPLPTPRRVVDGRSVVPVADRAAAEAGLAAAFEGVLVYWDSPLGR